VAAELMAFRVAPSTAELVMLSNKGERHCNRINTPRSLAVVSMAWMAGP
jgi:hypothetical protein